MFWSTKIVLCVGKNENVQYVVKKSETFYRIDNMSLILYQKRGRRDRMVVGL